MSERTTSAEATRRSVLVGLALAAVAWAPACSTDPDSEQPDSSLVNDAGGKSCRVYLTEGTYSMSGKTSSVTGSFDSKALVLKLKVAGAAGNQSSDTHYGALADFIDEPGVIGRKLCTKEVQSGDFSTETFTYSYDSQRRLTKRSGLKGGRWTYTAWDNRGRPTKGTVDLPPIKCTGVKLTIAYNDASRTVTTTLVAGGTCPFNTSVEEDTFDEQGNLLSRLVKGSPVGDVKFTITATKTATACKP
jgi:hypothetical protein